MTVTRRDRNRSPQNALNYWASVACVTLQVEADKARPPVGKVQRLANIARGMVESAEIFGSVDADLRASLSRGLRAANQKGVMVDYPNWMLERG